MGLPPFLTVIGWTIIMTMTLHPTYDRLCTRLGGRRRSISALVTLLPLGALIAPVVTRSASDAWSAAATNLDAALSPYRSNLADGC